MAVAQYNLPEVEQGGNIKDIPMASTKSLTGAEICLNFKTAYEGRTVFSLTVVLDPLDEFKATIKGIQANYEPTTYFANVYIKYADGEITQRPQFIQKINPSTGCQN